MRKKTWLWTVLEERTVVEQTPVIEEYRPTTTMTATAPGIRPAGHASVQP